MATRSLNKVLLIGNLTRDPEMRYTAKGTPVGVFGIATNRTWKDSVTGDIKEEAEFINIVTWNKLAEICYNLLAKGMLVFLEGELRTRSYENAKGEQVYRTEIHCTDMQLLNDKGRVGKGRIEQGTDDKDMSETKKEIGTKKNKGNIKDKDSTKDNGTGSDTNVDSDKVADADKVLDDDLVF